VQEVSQVQKRVLPGCTDLWQTHLKRSERFLPLQTSRKMKGVLSTGQTGVPLESNSKELAFELFRGVLVKHYCNSNGSKNKSLV